MTLSPHQTLAAFTVDVFRHLWDETVDVLRKGMLAISVHAVCHVCNVDA